MDHLSQHQKMGLVEFQSKHMQCRQQQISLEATFESFDLFVSF